VVSNTFGCSDTDAVDVNQDDEVPFVVATATGVRCFGDKNGTIRIDSVASNFDPLQYTLNGESIGSTTVITGLEPGPYLLEAEDTRGCITVLDTVWVTEPPELTINLGADITVSLGEVVTVNLATSVPLSALDTVLWIPLVDSSGAGQLFQQWMPLASGYLSVRVIDSAGCAVNDRILVVVDANRNVYFPNAIKPDSGFNDYFTAFAGQDVVEIESLQIYDRWGERVFERFNFQPNDPYIGWNGRFNGEEVQPGVYAWFAVVTFLDGEKILYTGDVTVVR
jgi:gliding motility-associated-like protein